MWFEIIASSLVLVAAGWFVTGVFCSIEIRDVLRRQRDAALRYTGMENGVKMLRIW